MTRADQGDFETAIFYLEEAVTQGVDLARADLVWALAESARCDEAAALLPTIAAADLDPSELEFATLWVDFCFSPG